jgi:hypothetical protein
MSPGKLERRAYWRAARKRRRTVARLVWLKAVQYA